MEIISASKKKSKDGDTKRSSKKNDKDRESSKRSVSPKKNRESSRRSASPKREKKIATAESSSKLESGRIDFEAGVIFSRLAFACMPFLYLTEHYLDYHKILIQISQGLIKRRKGY